MQTIIIEWHLPKFESVGPEQHKIELVWPYVCRFFFGYVHTFVTFLAAVVDIEEMCLDVVRSERILVLSLVLSAASEGQIRSLHPLQSQRLGLLLPNQPEESRHTSADRQSSQGRPEQKGERRATSVDRRPVTSSQGEVVVFVASASRTTEHRSFWFLDMIIIIYLLCSFICYV